MTVKIDTKRFVDDLIDLTNDCLVSLCQLRRAMDSFSSIKISNKLSEFKMIDKMAQKFESINDLDYVLECHKIMFEIVKELLPWHRQIFEEYPEYKEIFTTFLRDFNG